MEAVPQPLATAAPAGRTHRLARWYRRHIWAATGTLIALVVAAGFVALQLAVQGEVGAGVRAGEVPLAGLTLDAAQTRIRQQLAPRLEPLRLTAAGKTFDATLAQLGISVDARATAQAALARGRHSVAGVSLWLPVLHGETPVVVRSDAAHLSGGLTEIRAAVDVPARDATLKLSRDGVTVVPAKDGSGIDARALVRAIRASVAAGKRFTGALPMTRLAPHVSTADAGARAQAAAVYLRAPLTLRLRERTVTLTPRELAGMLSVTKGAGAEETPLTFDDPRARHKLRSLFAAYETPAVDATITPLAGGGVRFGQSREGTAIDMDQLVADMDAAASGATQRTVHVALRAVPPQVSTADVQSSGLAGLGSQFVTYFDPRNAARATNIALAAKLVDGAVVQPGAVFSLNGTMGPRTANRGFDYAPVIAADNVLRQGVGGGICQYATTLFNAVFFAGLPVVERHNHSIFIAHYPIGRDATVSWGSADFRFRNDTGKPLTIRSWTDGAALTVAVVGKTGRRVSSTTTPFYDLRKPAHTRSDPRVIYDGDLAGGITRWEKGANGLSVKVMRTVRSAGGTVLFRDTFTSVYRPMDWIERVGTG